MDYIIGLARNAHLLPAVPEQSASHALAALGYALVERLRALALVVTTLATAQVDTPRVKLLKVAAVVTRNTRRIDTSKCNQKRRMTSPAQATFTTLRAPAGVRRRSPKR